MVPQILVDMWKNNKSEALVIEEEHKHPIRMNKSAGNNYY